MDPINLLAAAAGPSMESTAEASDGAAPFEAAPNRRTMSIKTTSLKPASLKSAVKVAIKAATVVASVIWISPAVVPGASADKDPAHEPVRTIVAIGRASIRIVRVIAVSADRRASNITAEADPHSDPDLSLRIRERQRQ
jgi:hypothetical protein